MVFFKSKREKRLWLMTLLVVVGIFSTIGLATQFSLALEKYDLDAWFFLFGCFLVLVTVVTQGLNLRAGKVEWLLALGMGTVYYMVLLRSTLSTERSHLIEYGVLAVFVLEALKERDKHTKIVVNPAIIALIVTSLVGTLDELVQLAIPDRVFDPEDILFNFLGALLAIAASIILSWVRKRRN